MPDRLPVTSAGTYSGDFRTLEWGHLGIITLIFGSVYMWITLGWRCLAPGVIGFGHVALGAAALAVLPRHAGQRRHDGPARNDDR